MESIEQKKGNNAWSLKNNGSEFKATTGPSQHGTQVGICCGNMKHFIIYSHALHGCAHIFSPV